MQRIAEDVDLAGPGEQPGHRWADGDGTGGSGQPPLRGNEQEAWGDPGYRGFSWEPGVGTGAVDKGQRNSFVMLGLRPSCMRSLGTSRGPVLSPKAQQ